MDNTVERSPSSFDTPNVRKVGATRPFFWLRLGLSDIARMPVASLSYGVGFAVIGGIILSLGWGASHIVPALTTGFMLVAPFLAIMLYALSRQIELGEEVNSVEAFHSWRKNSGSVSLFGLMLALTLIMWERVAAIIFALFYGGDVPDLRNFLADVLFSGRYNELLIAYFGVGGIVAAVVFALSVVSLPMMLDRDVDIATAMVTSVKCVIHNPVPMLVWAVTIVVLMAIAFGTWMIGLVLVFPWLGHATWHAYRDLVD